MKRTYIPFTPREPKPPVVLARKGIHDASREEVVRKEIENRARLDRVLELDRPNPKTHRRPIEWSDEQRKIERVFHEFNRKLLVKYGTTVSLAEFFEMIEGAKRGK